MIDLQIDTPDGKNQLHGVTQVIFQEKDAEWNIENKYIASSSQTSTKKDKSAIYEINYCPARKPKNDTYPEFKEIVSLNEFNLYKLWDISWSVAKTSNNSYLVPTWSALNSLSTTAAPITAYSTTPIIHGTPIDWSNLYTALKIGQGINLSVTPDRKTVVSMDLQLYAKCIQLQANDTISSNYIFRLGELHILFVMLKVIGKNMNYSGLDEALIEANIYDPTTMEQIKSGKHYKRSFEAYVTKYLSLFSLYKTEFFYGKPVLKVASQESVSTFHNDVDIDQLTKQLNEIKLFS